MLAVKDLPTVEPVCGATHLEIMMRKRSKDMGLVQLQLRDTRALDPKCHPSKEARVVPDICRRKNTLDGVRRCGAQRAARGHHRSPRDAEGAVSALRLSIRQAHSKMF